MTPGSNASKDAGGVWSNRWLPLGLLLLGIGFYFGYLYQHAINAPLADDIYDVLNPIVQWTDAETLRSAFDSLYAQHNDHRTFATRLAYLGTLKVTGEINFRTLTFLAHLALPLLLIALYRMSESSTKRLVILLPAALLLLNLRAYGLTFWSMAAFAYFYSFLYAFYSIYFLQNASPPRFFLSALLATLASFTLASGHMGWVIGLALLIHQSLLRKRTHWTYVVLWVLIAAIVLTLWRYGFDSRNPVSAMLAGLMAAPGHHLLYTLTLLGSAVTESSVALAATTGGILLTLLVGLSVRDFREPDIRLHLCCWLVVACAAAIAMGRSFTAVDYALSARYAFPSTLMMACTWTLVAVRLNVRSWALLAAVVLATAAYCAHSWRTHSRALQPYMEKRVKNFNKGNYPAWPQTMRQSNGVVERAIELGIYAPPERPLPKASVDMGKNRPSQKASRKTNP